ncbi:hypothetical protein TSUD_101410 [Trifolium subterraneum]|uniref:Malectin-like domain-containing protein n=1 Tax=Trifolium subterraneum TaxID=3900 RepID=A0A2Z6N8Y4_TRISU|nr:hypothetical protein TSUD_101410 [Trifolium subterraneum]
MVMVKLVLVVTVIAFLVNVSFAVYTPADNYLIACGSSKSITFQDRVFVPDSQHSSLVLKTGNSIVVASSNSSVVPSPIYQSTRIFTENGSYRFDVSEVAFVNAIEVVSMPYDLFMGKSLSVGPLVCFSGLPESAFETIYRLNIGGTLLTAENDTLGRTWENDQKYLHVNNSVTNVSASPSRIRYQSGITNETAPNLVYATAVAMGSAINPNFNITWVFDVDPTIRSLDLSSMTNDFALPYYMDFVSNASSDNTLTVSIGPDALSDSTNASINGLEIMKISNALKGLDGSGNNGSGSGKRAFETVYRLNIGGTLLTAENDTLGRTWENDQKYLFVNSSVTNVSASPSSIRYRPGVTAETAPNWVYATAEAMGSAINPNFNITWVFDVDPRFSYFVRLHFCDIISKAMNTLVFNVFINTDIAIGSLDLSSMTNDLALPYFKDFVSNASSDNTLTVSVGPDTMADITNATMNGLEIMKISNDLKSLDGSGSDGSGSSNKHIIVVIVVIVVVILTLFVLLFAGIQYYRKKKKLPGENSEEDTVHCAISVALWCIQENMSMRPSMTRVVQMLEGLCTVPKPPKSSNHGNTSSDSYLSAVSLSGPR